MSFFMIHQLNHYIVIDESQWKLTIPVNLIYNQYKFNLPLNWSKRLNHSTIQPCSPTLRSSFVMPSTPAVVPSTWRSPGGTTGIVPTVPAWPTPGEWATMCATGSAWAGVGAHPRGPRIHGSNTQLDREGPMIHGIRTGDIGRVFFVDGSSSWDKNQQWDTWGLVIHCG